jgi:AhpD family alkylhydroperoxidase
MNREEVYKEIKDMFGIVPSFFKIVPDSTLELEWNLFKKMEVTDSAIPQKYRELIGLGLSAVAKCKYCIYYHTEMAKLFGATEAEIEEAVHYAKHSAGWSAYLNGFQLEYKQFEEEIKASIEYVRSHQEVHT